MVSQDRYEVTPAGQLDEPVDDASAVRTPVDVIAQGDDAVIGAGPDRLKKGVKSRRTAVNVTNGDGAWVHGRVTLIWIRARCRRHRRSTSA